MTQATQQEEKLFWKIEAADSEDFEDLEISKRLLNQSAAERLAAYADTMSCRKYTMSDPIVKKVLAAIKAESEPDPPSPISPKESEIPRQADEPWDTIDACECKSCSSGSPEKNRNAFLTHLSTNEGSSVPAVVFPGVDVEDPRVQFVLERATAALEDINNTGHRAPRSQDPRIYFGDRKQGKGKIPRAQLNVTAHLTGYELPPDFRTPRKSSKEGISVFTGNLFPWSKFVSTPSPLVDRSQFS